MKRAVCLVAVGLLAAATGAGTAEAQTAQQISVTSAAGAPTVEGGVTVYRGPGSGVADERVDAGVALEELAPGDLEIVGGDVVWFVNRTEGRLVGCNLRNTTTVGVRAITCTRRSLPRGARVAPNR